MTCDKHVSNPHKYYTLFCHTKNTTSVTFVTEIVPNKPTYDAKSRKIVKKRNTQLFAKDNFNETLSKDSIYEMYKLLTF